MKIEKVYRFLILSILLISASLLFSNLDNTSLWDDEAQSGIFARNLIKTGSLTGWDDYNLFGYRNGTLLDGNLRGINPPLYNIATASSYLFFGKISTWTSRFPHALIGFLNLLLFLLFLKEFYGDKDKLLILYIFISLAFSVTFILYMRQCLYYSLSVFFSLLVSYFYMKYCRKDKFKYLFFASLAAALLFYSHYLICAGFTLALASCHFLFYYNKIFTRKAVREVLLSFLIFLILVVPYAVYYKIWIRNDLQSSMNFMPQHLILLYRNFRDINLFYFMPWILLFLLLICFLFKRKKISNDILKRTSFILLLAFGNIFYISLLSKQIIIAGFDFADVRYLIASLPFFACVVGTVIYIIDKHFSRYLALTILIIYLSCNLFSVFPMSNWKFRWTLPAFIYELFTDSTEAGIESLKYINRNIPVNDSIFVFPEYRTYPLMFYLNNNYRFVCQLSLDSNISRKFIEKINGDFLYKELYSPDWIISYGNYDQMLLEYKKKYPDSRMLKDDYQLFGTVDVSCDYIQKAELLFHSFGTIIDYNKENQIVFVYKKKK